MLVGAYPFEDPNEPKDFRKTIQVHQILRYVLIFFLSSVWLLEYNLWLLLASLQSFILTWFILTYNFYLILKIFRNVDHHPAFVVVYNMDTTEIVSFYQVNVFHHVLFSWVFCVFWLIFTSYQNSPDELYLLFEQFCDHFHATSRNSMYMNFISSHSNNIHALEQLRSIKDKASSSAQVVLLVVSF